MGCDVTYVKQAAPARAVHHNEAQRTRPEPEHTGMGFHDSHAQLWPGAMAGSALVRTYRVRKLCKAGEFPTLSQALTQWKADRARDGAAHAALIEIADSATYHEAPHIRLDVGEHLQVRAVGLARPLVQIVASDDGGPGKIILRGASGSCLTLIGLTFSGGDIEIDDLPGQALPGAPLQVVLRHCTLLPDRPADAIGRTPWRSRSSLCVRAARVALRIEHSVLGPLCVAATAPGWSTLHLSDSTIDGGHAAGLVIADGAHGPAMLRARFLRATLIGVVQVHEVELADECMFLGPLLVARRTHGALRHCYVAPGSRTPPRSQCQLAPPGRGQLVVVRPAASASA